LTIEQLELWQTIYPDVDVAEVLKIDIIRWLDRNKERKITRKRAWKRFITSWLNAEQRKIAFASRSFE
jgi:hypothetical protein